MDSIVNQCVFCQVKQGWLPLTVCSTCAKFGGIKINDIYEIVVVCDAKGSVINGEFKSSE